MLTEDTAFIWPYRELLVAVIIMISFALTLLGSLFLWALGRSFEKVVFG
jgi:hypothetical protein